MGLVYHSLLPQDVPLMAHSVCLGLFFWRSSDAPTTAPGHTTYTHNPHSAISDEETHMHFARKMFNVVCTGTGSTMNRGGGFLRRGWKSTRNSSGATRGVSVPCKRLSSTLSLRNHTDTLWLRNHTDIPFNSLSKKPH